MSIYLERCVKQCGDMCHQHCSFDNLDVEITSDPINKEKRAVYVYSLKNRNCSHYEKTLYNFGNLTKEIYRLIRLKLNASPLPVQ